MIAYMKETLSHLDESIETPSPEVVIMNIMAEIAPMGGNDYEFSTLTKILENYQAKKISAAEAIIQATTIRDSKLRADYH